MKKALLAASLLALVSPSVKGASSYDGEVAARAGELRRAAGRADAIAPLLGLLDLWTLVDDRAPIAQLLDDAIADPRQRADVRARAVYLRSIVADRMGDRRRANELRAGLGLLSAFQVIGPFDNEGKGGHARVYPVERELNAVVDASRDYPGASPSRSERWRALPPEVMTQGLVALDAVLRPETNVTGYLTVYVRVPAATDAALRIGSSGAVKAWSNGRLALDHDVYRPVRIDQDAAALHLEAGWNRVTIKLSSAEAGWALFARLTRLDGGPLAFEQASSLPPGQALPRATRAPSGSARDLGVDLRAGAPLPLGLYLHYVAPEDPERKLAAAAMARAFVARPDPELARLGAMVVESGNERRLWLERGQAPAAWSKGSPHARARLLVELGDHFSRAHRDRRADELWRQALAEEPDNLEAQLKQIDLGADRGLPSVALVAIDALAARHPAAAVIQAGAQLADRLGRGRDAERRYQALLTATADELSALREVYSAARARGDVTGALALLDRIERARPDLTTTALDRAELLDGVGRSAEAHAVLERGLARCPDEAKLLERDGKILHRLGKDDDALARMKRSLALRPQNPELRGYLREVESQRAHGAAKSTGDDLARAYARPVAELIARARGKPHGAEAARVLLDLAATRVHENGLSETFSQRTVEILDGRGAREHNEVQVSYTPETQSVEVKGARVYKKDGEVVEASAQAERDISEPWYGLYYDVKAEVIEFPHLEPGDVIDVQYVVSDVGRRNLFADYFGELHLLQEELPRLESDYVLIAPRSRPLYTSEPKLPGLEATREERGGDVVYRFVAHDVPKVESEPGMPGFTEVAAYVHVSTYKTWEDVAEWYWGLARDQLQTDDAIKRAVAEAVRGKEGELSRIRAVYDLVVRKTRYVGLEFGIHGYQPYKVAQVFARKFGDCKDKASLLVAMLNEIHVPASIVLARTRRGGDLASFPASLAPFDHAIVYVPKHKLWLDGTAEFSGATELPAQDQDIPVLVIHDPSAGGKGHLARTPVLLPAQNRVTRDLQVAIAPTGAARLQVKMSIGGEAAHEWRAHYQTPGERLDRFEKQENATHPGAKVLSVEFPSIDDLERPVELRGELEVPSWGRVEGSEMTMPALGREGELLRSYARLSSRAYDLILGYPWEQEERVRIALPKGWSPRRLPEARRIDTPFGSFAVTVEQRGAEVALTTALRVNRHRIDKSDYPAFRRFCLDVDAAVGQELVISHD